MAPEVYISHDVRPDEKSDVWSLGVMLYELLTLSWPFNPSHTGPGWDISLQRQITEHDY
jgi:serine/threonine protein kinase